MRGKSKSLVCKIIYKQNILESEPAESPKEMQPLQGLKQGSSLRFCDRGVKICESLTNF